MDEGPPMESAATRSRRRRLIPKPEDGTPSRRLARTTHQGEPKMKRLILPALLLLSGCAGSAPPCSRRE
jgi:hypothetical protein